jgi:hypothetical protein
MGSLKQHACEAIPLGFAVVSLALSVGVTYWQVNAYSQGRFIDDRLNVLMVVASLFFAATGVWQSLENRRHVLICVAIAVSDLLIFVFMPACFGALGTA